ncbi:hypothetical protein EJ05DRAFT_503958 [Pseudovirgaria hyperparasitica]|uniref:Snf7-domain-containing protein n=1 Tax=Pseudovirgaria hyperparasitica TaxID=470096 RepID=A0A6A6VV33_9PEZI|nr:uncharacterized protein EJ05DRAFT_503958 [Pseudovirgaria hyperparasitica]KAF2754422.1 hypothetical protein EJ05DRAFT_503958 [Pseudovirgaria hyperparasitica]
MGDLLEYLTSHEEAFKSRNRLSSLYSDFSQSATINPDGYQANIVAWKKALSNAAAAGAVPSQGAANDLLSISTGEQLSRALASKEWGRPLALGAVIHEAVTKKEMIPLKDFLSATTSIYHRSWALSPRQAIAWGLRQLGILGEESNSEHITTGKLVIVANLESVATAILKHIDSKSSIQRIYSHVGFLSEFGSINSSTHSLTASDLEVLLTYLARDKHAITYNSTTIKFAAPSSFVNPEPISQQDTVIASLRSLIDSLNNQITILGSRIASLDSQARASVASKSRNTALTALRSKKLAEVTLARRSDTLAQLERTYNSIEAATDNVEIVRVMEASAGVLRHLNKAVGGASGVEGVVDSLREEIENVEEISGMLNEVGGAVVDEGEVDEEFEALERAECEKIEIAQRAERERQEAMDVERTRIRMDELQNLDKAQKDKEQSASKVSSTPSDDILQKGIEGMEQLSISSAPENRISEADTFITARVKEKEPAPTSLAQHENA